MTDRSAPASAHRWLVRGRDLLADRAGGLPLLMGILNVTPDSFSDGGRFERLDAAIAQAESLAAAGADVIDIGGESTRPGSEPVAADEERARTEPVVAALAKRFDVLLSIDTTKASVARAALDAGAAIVNDISGLTFDRAMVPLCADSDCGVVAMHIRGTPATMQEDPQYGDVLAEVDAWLTRRLDALAEAGIGVDRVMLDPGIGFGKTAAHNLALMQGTPTLRRRRPVLVGHSRKRFLKSLLGREVEERLAGTLGVSIALAGLGADMLRVHDVAAVRDALTAHRVVSQSVGATRSRR